jgi:hypothetical protein
MIEFLEADIERLEKHHALRRGRDPFGSDSEPDSLSKNVRHNFKAGDRVTVDSPGHHAHGHAGKIVDDRSDSRLEVKLDSGHTIHCAGSDLVPEDFPDPVETIANALKRGETVTAGTRLQKIFESYPNIQKFVSNGQIRFQDRDKIFG